MYRVLASTFEPTELLFKRNYYIDHARFREILVKDVEMKELPLYTGWHCSETFAEMIASL